MESSQTVDLSGRAGRYGTYEDIAHAVRHLASGGASYVTGTHIKVSGGYLI